MGPEKFELVLQLMCNKPLPAGTNKLVKLTAIKIKTRK
jgi:hypothetical protein